MKKYLVLGDIHGRQDWKNIIASENPDKIIFLGDYVSTHEDITPQEQIYNLTEILHFKESNPEKVILLRGNHDIQHLGYYWAECSGYDYVVLNWMTGKIVKEKFLSLTDWIYKDNGFKQAVIYNKAIDKKIYTCDPNKDILFSHAGVSSEWITKYMVNKNIFTNDPNWTDELNKLEPSEEFGFLPCKMSDYYGVSATQPLTWIRPQTLVEYALPGYDQVVGHTRTYKDVVVLNAENDFKDKVYVCDCLPYDYLILYKD